MTRSARAARIMLEQYEARIHERIKENIMTEKAIRNNWMLALSKEECISPTIEWAFNFQDLIVLGAIHRSGVFREKIEDLLEDCNFHPECGLLADGKYGEYLDLVFEEYARFNFV